MQDRLSEQVLQSEQKKYGLDRMIYTCNKVKKHLEKFVKDNKIQQYQGIVKKQPELELLSDQKVSIREKNKLLEKTLEETRRKKYLLVAKEEKSKIREGVSLNQEE